MIHIICNNQPETIKKNTTLDQFLSEKGLNTQGGIAVAINNQVVSKDRWNETSLKENDSILIIGASYGG